MNIEKLERRWQRYQTTGLLRDDTIELLAGDMLAALREAEEQIASYAAGESGIIETLEAENARLRGAIDGAPCLCASKVCRLDCWKNKVLRTEELETCLQELLDNTLNLLRHFDHDAKDRLDNVPVIAKARVALGKRECFV
jgi:hypothetical protein